MVMQEINPLKMASLHIVYDNMCPLEEKDGRRGVFHLIEHLIGVLFDPLLPDLHEYAINDDMCTSHEHVMISFSGTADAIEFFAPRIMHTIATASSSKISKEMFEMERDAVYNEMRDLDADFYADTMRTGLRKVYGIQSPEGDIEDVRAYTYEQFKKDFDELVPHPTNICYIGPHNIDLPDLRKQPYNIGKYPKFPFKADSKARRSDINTNNDSVVVSAFSSKPVMTNKEYAALNIACYLLGGSPESVMYDELRAKRHLVYSCSSSVEPFRTAAVPIFYTSAAGQDARQVIGIMKKIFSDPVKYLDEDKFNKCKHMFINVLEQQRIMRFTAPGALTRYNMITDTLDIRDITYRYMLRVAKKYIGKDTFRFFVG